MSERWLPPPVALAGPSVRYDDAPPWAPGSCGGTFSPGAAAVRNYVRQRWGMRVGGYACRPNTANRAATSMHGTGRAIDIMIPAGQSAVGDEIGSVLGANAAALGVQLIIWRRTLVNYSRPEATRARAYTGPNAHTDHLHVELNADAAARRTPWFLAGMPALTVPPSVPGVASSGPVVAVEPSGVDDAAGFEDDTTWWWVAGAGAAAAVAVAVWRRRRRR